MEGSKILIITEDFDLRTKISEILKIVKYNVKSTDSGRQAIVMMRSDRFDVVICGINVLEIDGFGILSVVNKFSEISSVSFIMLLNEQNHRLAGRAMEMGADGYLASPFDDAALLHQVERRLRKKRFQYENFVRQHNLPASIPDSTFEKHWVRSHFEEKPSRPYRKSQILYHPGERQSFGLHYVVSGKIKTYITDAFGNVMITGICGTGDYFGLQGILLRDENMEAAEAIEDSRITTIPSNDVDGLLSACPQLLSVFVKDLARNLNQRNQRLLETTYYSVRKRVAKALTHLAEVDYNVGANGKLLLPRNDFARIVGVASETLSRVLSDFAKEKLIEKDGHNIIILNKDALKGIKN